MLCSIISFSFKKRKSLAPLSHVLGTIAEYIICLKRKARPVDVGDRTRFPFEANNTTLRNPGC